MSTEEWVSAKLAELRGSPLWGGSVTSVAPQHPATGFVINVDAQRVVAQFIVWTSGAMEATAADVNSGESFYSDEAAHADVKDLEARWSRFVDAIARIEQAE